MNLLRHASYLFEVLIQIILANVMPYSQHIFNVYAARKKQQVIGNNLSIPLLGLFLSTSMQCAHCYLSGLMSVFTKVTSHYINTVRVI